MKGQNPRKILRAGIEKSGITQANLIRKSGVSQYKLDNFLSGKDIGIVDYSALINACGYQIAFCAQDGLITVQ